MWLYSHRAQEVQDQGVSMAAPGSAPFLVHSQGLLAMVSHSRRAKILVLTLKILQTIKLVALICAFLAVKLFL